MADESIPGPPFRNPYFVPGGHSDEFPRVGSHHGLWVEAESPQGNRLGYWIWREIPKQYSLREPLSVVTPTGVKFKSPA